VLHGKVLQLTTHAAMTAVGVHLLFSPSTKQENLSKKFSLYTQAGGGAPEMESRLSTLATCGLGVRTYANLCHAERLTLLRIVEQAAGHVRWKVDYPPSQPVGVQTSLEANWLSCPRSADTALKPYLTWRPLPAKLPSIGGYSHETVPYLSHFSEI